MLLTVPFLVYLYLATAMVLVYTNLTFIPLFPTLLRAALGIARVCQLWCRAFHVQCSTVDCNSTFDHQGLPSDTKQFGPEEDLRGRNVVLLRSTELHEMLNITTDIQNRGHGPLPTSLLGCL